MDGPSKDAPQRKKLVLTVNNRAALSGLRSNFVPQSKTVVVHRQSTVVLDSPERAARDKLNNARTTGLNSLSSIGRQHFKHQTLLAGGGAANTASKTLQPNRPPSAGSAFLDANPSSSSIPPATQSVPSKLSSLARLVNSVSQADKANTSSSNPAVHIPVGPATLSSKFKARVERNLEESSRASVVRAAQAPTDRAVSFCAPHKASETSSVEFAASEQRDSSSGAAATSSGLSGLFQGMGKTLAVKRLVTLFY